MVQTTLDTYPELDFVMPQVAEVPTWGEAYLTAWQALDAKFNLEARFPVQSLIEAARNRRGYHGGSDMAVMQVKSEIAALYLIDRLFSEQQDHRQNPAARRLHRVLFGGRGDDAAVARSASPGK